MLLLLSGLFTLATTSPQILHAKTQTLRFQTFDQCNTPSIIPSSSFICIDVLTLSFDQPLYYLPSSSSSTNPSNRNRTPQPINGIAVQSMLNQRTISFHGNPTHCLSWQTYEYDQKIRRQNNNDKNNNANDIDLNSLIHQSSKDQGTRQHNLMRFIQRTPCRSERLVPITCHISIKESKLGTYHSILNQIKEKTTTTTTGTTTTGTTTTGTTTTGTTTGTLIVTNQSFHMHEKIEDVYAFVVDSTRTIEQPQIPNTNNTEGKKMDTSTMWGDGSCILPSNTEEEEKEDSFSSPHYNYTTLSLLETKDRMAIMTQVFKGMITDIIDGTVGGAAGPALEQTESRAGEADTDDMRGKMETSLDGTAPVKIAQMLEASLTYNLTGLLTDAVTAALSPRLSSTLLDNVGSVVARVVVDETPNLVSDDIAKMLIVTLGERLDGALPELLKRSLGPRLVNILTRSLVSFFFICFSKTTALIMHNIDESQNRGSCQCFWMNIFLNIFLNI